MPNQVNKVFFNQNIKDLFRPRDVAAMKNFGGFDLSKYADVAAHSDQILSRIKNGDMPCDAPWPSDWIAKLEQWITDGKLP